MYYKISYHVDVEYADISVLVNIMSLKILTVNVFSPDGPIEGTLLLFSLSTESHRHLLSICLVVFITVLLKFDSDLISTRDFISCSHRLPGDQILCARVLPFIDRFRGASSSKIKY